jgi:outer membrane protein assembly factor BamB
VTRVAYSAGVDLGTLFTSAVTARAGQSGSPQLSAAVTIPSVLYVDEYGGVLAGEDASRRRITDPDRIVQGFRHRVGASTPIVVGGTPIQPELLLSHQLRGVLELVTADAGRPPATLTVAHSVAWAVDELDSLRGAAALASVADTALHLVSEPEAVAVDYADRQSIEEGDAIAVFDFGGAKFAAAVLRRIGGDRFELAGRPRHIDHLGGTDLDALILDHIDDELGGAITELDPQDPDERAALARLRAACEQAKVALSTARDTTFTVALPASTNQIVVSRSAFEEMARPAIAACVTALGETIASAGLDPVELDRVVLVGGASQIPLVAREVSSTLFGVPDLADRADGPVHVEPYTRHAVARGAALVGARDLARPEPPPRPPDGRAGPTDLSPPPPATGSPPAPPTAPEPSTGRGRRSPARKATAAIAAAVVAVGGIGAVAAIAEVGPFGSAGGGPVALEPVADRGDAWVRSGIFGGVAKVDVAAGEVVANVPINGADTVLYTLPSRPLVTDDSVWAATRDRQEGPIVHVIDRQDAAIRHRVPLEIDDPQLAPLGLARTADDGVWATFSGEDGHAVAALLDSSGLVETTVEVSLYGLSEPVSDGHHLFAVGDAGEVLRIAPDGAVDTVELDGPAGAVAYTDGAVYAFRSGAVDRIDPSSLDVDDSVDYTRDGRPFEVVSVDEIPRLAAVAVSGTTAAFVTFDEGDIVNVVSLAIDTGEVATFDELPIGGADETLLPAGSVSRVGPDGELWVNVQQSVVHIEDGQSELFTVENPIRGSGITQDLAVIGDGVVRNDTDDQGFSTITVFDRDEREASMVIPAIGRTISPLYEGGRFWLFGEIRGPVVAVDSDRNVTVGEPIQLDGISSGPIEVAGQVWAVTFKTNDPHATDDNERELTILDADDGSVVERRPFEFEGALIVDGEDVWVSGSDFVKIDPTTMRELARVESSGYQITPIGFAFGMGIPDDLGHGAIWNLTDSGVRRIDTASLDVTETSLSGQPFSATVAGDWAWVTTVDGTLYRLDPATGEVAGSVDVGDELIEVVAAGSTPYAVEIDGGAVHRITIDTDGSDRVTATAEVEPGPVTWRAHQGFLWVANEATGRLFQIDQAGEIAKTLLLDGRPSVIASDGGATLLVGLQDRRAVSVIDVGVRGELAEIALP